MCESDIAFPYTHRHPYQEYQRDPRGEADQSGLPIPIKILIVVEAMVIIVVVLRVVRKFVQGNIVDDDGSGNN